MKNIILLTSLLFSSVSFADFGNCNVLFPKGKAPQISDSLKKESKELCFTDFAVLYSVKTKTPIYTVEKLSYLRKFLKESRTNNFHEEMRLQKNERSTLDDYKNSGYDRGHLVPAANCTNMLCMSDSFSLANMFPQASSLNRGAWAKSVEKSVRKYVERASGDIYVFTGGFGGTETIGKGKVLVPEYVWKLVYDSQTKKSWVYWLKNEDSTKMSKPISYEEFVQKTGLKLLD